MKRILLFILLLSLVVTPAWSRDIGGDEIKNIPKLQASTANYMALNTTMTAAEIRALDDNIISLNSGGTVTLTSQTMNLSTVNGTAFISNPLTDLRPYVGFKLTITAGGKTLVGWGKAAGTGETYDANKYTNPDFGSSTVGWNPVRGTIASVAGGESGNCCQLTYVSGTSQVFEQSVAKTAGALYIFGGSVKSGTSGDEAVLIIYYDNTYNNERRITKTSSGTWVAYTDYNTCASAVAGQMGFYKNTATAGTMLFDSAILKQVLTPSSTGVTIVSASGGATYNWTSNDGIDPNATSFTISITK